MIDPQWKWELGDLVIPKGMLEETRRIANARGECPYFSPARVILRMYVEGLLDNKTAVEYQYRIRIGAELRDYMEHELVSANELFQLWMELKAPQ